MDFIAQMKFIYIIIEFMIENPLEKKVDCKIH